MRFASTRTKQTPDCADNPDNAKLLAQAQGLDQRAVTLEVLRPDVVQQVAALTHQLQQAAPAREIFCGAI